MRFEALPFVRRLPAALLALAIVLTAAPADAALRAGESELGFDVGATQFDDNVADDWGPRVGVRYGFCIADPFELEVEALVSTLDVDGDDVTLSAAFVNAVFNFHPAETIVPYVLVGAGTAEIEVDFGDVAIADDDYAVQAAIGSRFFFGHSNMGLRIEAAAMRERTFGESSTHLSLTGGLTWRLP